METIDKIEEPLKRLVGMRIIDGVLPLNLRLDVFMIWSTILIAIGLQVVGRVRKGPSFVVAALVWLLGAIPTVLPVLLRG